MYLWSLYHRDIPDFLWEAAQTPLMQRLKEVGMNCGCEYTSFERFARLAPYSRYDHSMGCALIVWHFTADRRQSLAALLHDVATPVFAHVIDFLNGDHLRQESTESATADFIASSPQLICFLARQGLEPDEVSDYHRYPVADNDIPRLSSDRLEYSLGNVANYGLVPIAEISHWYGDLVVGKNEEGTDELMFRDTAMALAFATAALDASRIYVADEDRYAMQMLAELLKKHIQRGVLDKRDLYSTEPEVIARLSGDVQAAADWRRFCSYRRMIPAEGRPEARCIAAKKRYIDPFVMGRGRLSALSVDFASNLRSFLSLSFEQPICAD